MRLHRFSSATFSVGLVVALGLGVSGALAGEKPVPVSPGDASKLTQVAGACPTFDWGGVSGAQSYELVVYRVGEPNEEAEPVLRQTVPGTANGWTPPLDRCLERGGRYAWSVRALWPKTRSDWSAPSLFEVAAAPSLVELETALAVVKSYLEEEGWRAPSSEQVADPPAEAKTETETRESSPVPRGVDAPELSVEGGVEAVWFRGDGSQVTSLDPASLSGPVGVDKGGTGATDAAGALTNIGAAATAHTHAQCTPGDLVTCYSGDPVTRDVGVCESGTRLCQAGGSYDATCQGEVGPSDEQCDGLDNDCDTATDEDDIPPICPLTDNVLSTSCTSVAGCPNPSGICCAIVQCVAGFDDTDGDYANGCEDDNRRTVFVTSTGYTGNLGGLSGADDKCNERAMAASPPLTGVFRAWLSDSAAYPADGTRFEQSSEPYVLVDGTQVADNWTDLTDGSLDHAIDLDESGAPASFRAWTGTAASGQRSTGVSTLTVRCTHVWDSASAADHGVTGSTSEANSHWTDSLPQACDFGYALYCFEQE